MPSLICHDTSSTFKVPLHWVKDENFAPCEVNEQNRPWNKEVDQGTKYRLIAKYEENYGSLARIGRATLGATVLLAFIGLTFKVGKHLVYDIPFRTYHLIAGNETLDGILGRVGRTALGAVLLLIVVSWAFKLGKDPVYNLLFHSVKNFHLIREPIAEALSANPRLEEIVKIQCPIARGTGIAIAEGFYMTPSGIKVVLRSGAELLNGSQAIANSLLKSAVEPRYTKTAISVVDQDCLEAAEEELKKEAEKVAVLMLASPIEPGGAMEEGNQGQEEDLCRRSNIFGFMWDQAHFLAERILYNLVDVKWAHQVNPDYSSMVNNRMIHVPQVTVFRSGKANNYQMLKDPFVIGMLVSPGLDRPEYQRKEGKTSYKRPEDEQQLLKLMMTQLKVAYDHQYDTVILGAFGCGAFYNPPELIAEFYQKVIDTYFKGAFRKIVFAILDDGFTRDHNPEGNLRPFQTRFPS